MASITLDMRDSEATTFATVLSACEYVHLNGARDYVRVTNTTFNSDMSVRDQLNLDLLPAQYEAFVERTHKLPTLDEVEQWDCANNKRLRAQAK